MTTLTIEGLKPLTTAQYDECRVKALDRVSKRIGDKPERKDFQREMAPLWTILDVLALIVFVCALAVSSAHIITHMGKLADQSFTNIGTQAGKTISRDDYVALHQIGMIFLAEGSMILFMVLFGMSAQPKAATAPGQQPKAEFNWRRWVYLFLALVSLVFVGVANWQSQIGLLESVLAPFFTIGIGLKLELLIVELLKRRAVVDEKYLKAVGIWEAATADATSHPDYLPMFRQEVWAALAKKNRDYVDAPRGFKYGAVDREMARDRWAYEPAPVQEVFQPVEEVRSKQLKEVHPEPAAVPFGEGGALMLDENDNMQPVLSANGHGTTAAN